MKFNKLLFVVIFFLCVTSQAVYCQSHEARKKIANAEKVEEKQKKAEEKEQIAERKAHMGRQTKATRKRMKNTDKRAENFNKRSDKTIFQRIFNKQQRKTRKKYG